MAEKKLRRLQDMSVIRKHDKEGGFTLIELSIIIIVLSLIITPLFAMMQAQRKEQDRS